MISTVSAMETLDALRGLPSEMAEKICIAIWAAVNRDFAIRSEMVAILSDLARWEESQIQLAPIDPPRWDATDDVPW